MRHFTPTELERMRATQQNAMQDECAVLAYSSVPDAYGNPVATYTAGSGIPCGVELLRPSERQASGEVPRIDLRLRLPLETVFDPRDRIRVIYRYGAAVTQEDYDIVGPSKRGPSGLVVECVKTVR